MTERPSEEHTNHVVIQREAEIGRGNAFRWASLAKEDLLPAKQSLEIGVGERGTPEVTFLLSKILMVLQVEVWNQI